MGTLGHQNVANTKYFATFIARLFVGSFQNEGIKQDFHQYAANWSIVGHIRANYGRGRLVEHLGVNLDVFNSASISVAYYLALLKEWAKKGERNIPVHNH